MSSNKIGKPSKVQILLLYTSGQNGGKKKSLSNLRTPKQRNCKILNCKAKETHLIPQEFKYVFQLGYTIPHKDMEAHKNLETQYSHCEPAGSKPTGPSTHQPGHLLGLSAANALPPWGTQGRKILSEVPVSQQKHTTVRCQYVRSGFPAAKRTPSVPKQPGLLCVSKRRAEIHNQNNIILPS